MGTIFFIILAILALMIIVIIHELGHFLAAKKYGVKVEEFGVGFPPRAWGKKFEGTIYSINWLPLGGFVRLHGETLEENPKYPTKAFKNAPAHKKIFIALAGVFMNFLLALICFTIVYSIVGVQKEVETGKVVVTDVNANTPAQTAGIIVGDVVKSVNKTPIATSEEFIKTINDNKGKKVQLTLERSINEVSEEKNVTLTPRENPPEGQGALGVAITSKTIETYYPPLWQRPFIGFREGVKQTLTFTQAVFGGIAQMATDAGQGKAPSQLCGPFCIVAVFADQIKTGFVNFISFVGVVSLNLAVLNLIPFPPLDGSRVLFVILEKFVSKKKLPKIERYSYTVGFILLLTLVALITLREVPKLIQAGSLSGFVDQLIQ